MKAISIDDGSVVKFSTEEELLGAFDAEYIDPELPMGVNTIYVYICPMSLDLKDERVLRWATSRDQAESDRYEHGQDV